MHPNTSLKNTAGDKRRPYTLTSNMNSYADATDILRQGNFTAHELNCLMLLGSPPDMVHSRSLRETRPSTYIKIGTDRTNPALGKGNHPCFSGLQVQGTADSPAGMVFFHFLLFVERKIDIAFFAMKAVYHNSKTFAIHIKRIFKKLFSMQKKRRKTACKYNEIVIE